MQFWINLVSYVKAWKFSMYLYAYITGPKKLVLSTVCVNFDPNVSLHIKFFIILFSNRNLIKFADLYK